MSYAAFAGAIDAATDYFKAQEVPAGGTVIVLIENLFDCWVAVLALQSLGLVTVCIKSPYFL